MAEPSIVPNPELYPPLLSNTQRDTSGESIVELRTSNVKTASSQAVFGDSKTPPSRIPSSIQNSEEPSVRSRSSVVAAIIAWRWELITWTLGSLSLLVTLVLLFIFQDKPIRQWHFPVQITAVVAVLAQVSQSALLVPISSGIGQLKWKWFQKSRRLRDIERFDEASRGPWGSVMLLVYMRIKPYLACLGAASTLLLLFYSSFLQQAVRVDLAPTNSTGTASIARAVNYTISGGNNPSYFKSPSSHGWEPVEPLALGAIYSGLYGAFTSPSNVTGYCPHGDSCAWSAFTNLAICSSFEDLSPSILPSYTNGSQSAVIPDLELIDGTTLYTKTLFYFDAEEYGVVMNIDQIRSEENPDSNLRDLATIYMLYWDPCSGEDYGTGSTKGFKAHKGKLRLCLQTLAATLMNSTTHTEILNSRTDLNWDKDYCTEHEGERFCFDYHMSGLSFHLGKTLNGSASLIPGGDNYFYAEAVEQLATDVIGQDPTQCAHDSTKGFNGFQLRISNIAASLSNMMRTANGSRVARGGSTQFEQHILVDIPWLVMPIILWVMITLFFYGTVWSTKELPAWKNLALVHLQCRDADNRLYKGMEFIKKDANARQARLEQNRPTWQLVEDSAMSTTSSTPDSGIAGMVKRHNRAV